LLPLAVRASLPDGRPKFLTVHEWLSGESNFVLAAITLAACLLLTGTTGNAGKRSPHSTFGQPGKDWHEKGKGAFDGHCPPDCRQTFQAGTARWPPPRRSATNGRALCEFRAPSSTKPCSFLLRSAESHDARQLQVDRVVPPAWRGHADGNPTDTSPYQTLWSVHHPGADGWSDKDFLISLREKSVVPVGLFLYIARDTYDLSSIKLVKLDAQSWPGPFPAPRPIAGISSATAACPWVCRRAGRWTATSPGGLIEADPANPGPSGSPP